jgi:osmoprotectant transport system substrate-binding protein
LTVQDFGLIYQSTADGDPCNFGEVFTTDGRIQSLDLALMEDTEHAFISYLSSVMINNDFYEEHPDLMVAAGSQGSTTAPASCRAL